MKPDNYNEYDFKNIYPIQIRFDDIDGMGHVNNTILMSYFDYGKWKYIEAINAKLDSAEKIVPIIAHLEVDFFEPVFINEQIDVQTKIVGFGTKSLQLVQRLVSANNAVKSVCKGIMVGFDKETNCALPIPESFKRISQEMEA